MLLQQRQNRGALGDVFNGRRSIGFGGFDFLYRLGRPNDPEFFYALVFVKNIIVRLNRQVG